MICQLLVGSHRAADILSGCMSGEIDADTGAGSSRPTKRRRRVGVLAKAVSTAGMELFDEEEEDVEELMWMTFYGCPAFTGVTLTGVFSPELHA